MKSAPQLHPASAVQRKIWFLQQMTPSSSEFNIAFSVAIRGPFNKAIFLEAARAVCERHDVARSALVMANGLLMQAVHSEVDIQVDEEECPLDTPVDRSYLSAPFSLDTPPLWRCKVIRHSDDCRTLIFVGHHSMADGLSVEILIAGIWSAYNAIASGEATAQQPLPLQYHQYAREELLSENKLAPHVAFWRESLRLPLPELALPIHRRASAGRSERCIEQLSADLSRRIKRFAMNSDVTPYSVFMCGWFCFLSSLTGQDDLVVGCPISGRIRPELTELVGPLTDVAPVRLCLERGRTLRETIERCRLAMTEVFEHRPGLDRAIRELPVDAHGFRVLYSTTFNLLPSKSARRSEDSGLGGEITPLGDTALDRLSIDVFDENGEFAIHCTFGSGLLSCQDATALLREYRRLLVAMIADPDQVVGDLAVQWEQGNSTVPTLMEGNCVQVEDIGLGELFQRQVKKTPDAPALLFEGRSVTYGELDQKASGIAGELEAGSNGFVGIHLPRSIELVAAVLGVVKAGLAYVFIDPQTPKARKHAIAEDAGISVLLDMAGNDVLFSDVNSVAVDKISHSTDFPPVKANELLCLIYTSGSTGAPKGVQVSQRALLNRLSWGWNEFPYGAEDVCCLRTIPSFVDALTELFSPLLKGVPIVIASDEVARDSMKLWKLLRDNKVSRIALVPSILDALLKRDLPGDHSFLRLCTCSGETLTGALASEFRRQFPDAELVNLYGSSEDAADVAWHRISADDFTVESVPFGKPIWNTEFYLLDERGFAHTSRGELCVGGAALSSGYWKNDELTSSRFMEIESATGRKLVFRTGDICAVDPRGDLFFVCRKDLQFKVRGILIEPGEIESVMVEHPAIAEVVVIPELDQQGQSVSRILACYTMKSGEAEPSPDGLREFAGKLIPDWALPNEFVLFGDLPRTPAGKIDRQALYDSVAVAPASKHRPPTAPPSTELEIQLARIWETVFGIGPVGVDDSFFELGGNSLNAAEIFAAFRELTGNELPLAALFKAPTIRRLCRILIDEGWESSWKYLVPINAGGCKQPLFCFHGGFSILAYHDLARALGDDQPVFGLQYSETEVQHAQTLEELVADYVREIRTVQPTGPYHVAGSSAAGIVSFEAARQLREAGEEVALLAMFDTYGPGYPELLPKTSLLQFRLHHWYRRIEHHWGSLRMLPMTKRPGYLVRKTGNAIREARVAFYDLLRWMHIPAPKTVPDWAVVFWSAMEKYQLSHYDGEVTLFRATKLPIGIKPDDSLGWSKVAPNLRIIGIPGFHGAIISEPRVKYLVEELAPLINEKT